MISFLKLLLPNKCRKYKRKEMLVVGEVSVCAVHWVNLQVMYTCMKKEV